MEFRHTERVLAGVATALRRMNLASFFLGKLSHRLDLVILNAGSESELASEDARAAAQAAIVLQCLARGRITREVVDDDLIALHDWAEGRHGADIGRNRWWYRSGTKTSKTPRSSLPPAPQDDQKVLVYSK